MNTFLTADFLLKSDTAKALYHNHAAKMPIIDYHCHLNPQQVAENYGFADLTESGWEAIITNGGPCVPTAFRKSTSPDPNHLTKSL